MTVSKTEGTLSETTSLGHFTPWLVVAQLKVRCSRIGVLNMVIFVSCQGMSPNDGWVGDLGAVGAASTSTFGFRRGSGTVATVLPTFVRRFKIQLAPQSRVWVQYAGNYFFLT
jgi:hypothetical protein